MPKESKMKYRIRNLVSNPIPGLLILVILLAGVLRVSFLDRFPPALYSDEVSQGYNAYSIWKTGRDEYGKFLPVSLRSFGDWKPPLPTYLMIPTIAIFGLNAWGVRLPSAILGTLTVGLVYFLVSELLQFFEMKTTRDAQKTDFNRGVALWSALFLAISAWHIAESRSAMLVAVGLFWICMAIWSFLKGLKQPNYWYISSLSLVFGIYTYYGLRLVVPLLLIALAIFFIKPILRNWQKAIVAAILGTVLLLPLIVAYIKEPDVLWGRARTVSIFYDQGVALNVKDLIAQDGIGMPPKLAQFFHNKTYAYTVDIIRRFFQHLDGRYLFLIGDQSPPFQIPGMGILYLGDVILLIFGLNYLSKNSRLLKFLLVWAAITIVPSALTFVTPASNRTFNLVVPLVVIMAFGAVNLFGRLNKYFFWSSLFIIYGSSFAYFSFNYFKALPKQHADWWHYGYQELYAYLATQESQVETIYISGHASVPYIFLLFFQEIDPALVATQIKRNYKADIYGFEHVDEFGKYQFPRYFKWEVDKDNLASNSLLVLTESEVAGEGARDIKDIIYPDGRIAFKIYKIE
ncbi:MAG: Glycosyl transferase family 39 [Candidatus Gottesmanbacteria bacterium GW2011_GWB1_43_11]|uniref:Glycosyl transferase family 39 n=1 Tax=Candidatus Gottesmanbacteria bacterium GW2011_GWB1_43_11 TaxID=1618446 RepID=A0A0G1CPM3_9BACT|nr:MAG: Glycosyl transferase family 39 [Candidatus Gottesmanbacteria bacterium GW2011_GWA2_42_16]KKS56219.1 MAG: Glycosyl transferase family 39 [Candidatus Gottesmanbacteria bacterium GW2011_GWA1_42_26]KKS82553.1 MAG: Glycosyl transferase family 39 [Candidatus Gottesmanbacteria bacterium GW2011_GWC1_43_10]KKS87422.1 MAG: Glycosyl transferase family 39 [Candidatus Gottesmanbacteria bacterium GW2011_GWB1_43_11]OGG10203.1 MAG: hypothetical protein A2699_01490 [Candidatus Gottesmanbacteria bacteriu